MELKVKNIGCIESAELSFNGLTVIAGENGSGKSTLSKMIFSIIKAVANIAQENESAQNVLLEKYSKALYQRLSLRRLTMSDDAAKLFPNIAVIFAHRIAAMQGTDMLTEYLANVRQYIQDCTDYSPRVKLLALKDVDSIEALMSQTDAAQQLGSEIRFFVESEFMNQITTDGTTYSHVSFSWGNGKGNGVIFDIKNDEMNIIECSMEDALEDATYIESPLYMPLLDSLRRASTYIENMKSTILQPMVPLHVKDIINKYDLLSHYKQDNEVSKLLKTISNIMQGKFVYDDAKRLIYFRDDSGLRLMPINVASGVKAFGLLQILLQIGAIGPNKPLLWDEPENHLHPEWQIKFAEMLVLLSKMGMPIVISTHSPYFIQSIRYYASKYGMSSFVNYYFTEKKKGNLVNVVETTDNLNYVFAKLAQPLSYVMNIPNKENEK